jgi:ribosomal protein S18 acetylase RimI-like enzyme
MNQLLQRKAKLEDLPTIVALLLADDLGQHREIKTEKLDSRYIDAFHRIDTDPNQYLMVVINPTNIVGTCHLTLMPSLTFIGSTRLQIEAVRIAENYRGQKIGEWMMNAAIAFAKLNHATILQLTTNKQRPRAKQFYERLGFKTTHEGMKYYIKDEPFQPENQ